MIEQLKRDDPVIIVGAGVFGLSSALHFARRGYSNVTVFDRQDYDKSLYSYAKGCDAASAGKKRQSLTAQKEDLAKALQDINKIIRSAYGTQVEYQELSMAAIEQWKEWNDEIANGDVPPGMSQGEKVFYNSGAISFNEGKTLPPFEQATIEAMTKTGHRNTQLVTTNSEHREIAKEKGFNPDQFRAEARQKNIVGVIDTNGGHVVADKACQFALHKAKTYGARFVLDPVAGAFESLLYDDSGKVAGIRTQDGLLHAAKLTIMACGAYTPILVPELDGLCEATAGSVVVIQIPETSPLFDRFSADNFPVWMYRMRDGVDGGLYGFPIDSQGQLKIGYRGTKYTNPQLQPDGGERSVPVTRYTKHQQITEIPRQAMKTITSFVAEYLPEILQEGLEVKFTRLCWYNDSFDNHLVIDQVPQKPGLMVATGDSGHAFKYLPNIGNWIVDIVEGVGMERTAIKAWKWRAQGETRPVNVLMEGRNSTRALQNVSLASQLDQRVSKRSAML